jgi:hypothetical protein
MVTKNTKLCIWKDLRQLWLSCLGPLVFLLPTTFSSFWLSLTDEGYSMSCALNLISMFLFIIIFTVMFNNAININKTNNNLPTNTTEHTRPWNMALETKVLTWDRNKYVEGLKRLMAFQTLISIVLFVVKLDTCSVNIIYCLCYCT